MITILVAQGLVAALVGACLGSLASLLAYRLPRDQPVGRTRSRCPACDATLGVRDLVPIVSWLALRGRCRHCGSAVSWRYPALEAAMAAMVILAWAVYGATWAAASLAVLATLLTVAVIVDLEWLIIPDETMIGAALAGVAWRAAGDQAWLEAGLAAALVALLALALRALFTRLRGIEALGLGDVKLMAVAGLWLPAETIPAFFVLAGGIGIATALLWRRRGGAPQFPFGPGLAAGLYATLLASGAGLLP